MQTVLRFRARCKILIFLIVSYEKAIYERFLCGLCAFSEPRGAPCSREAHHVYLCPERPALRPTHMTSQHVAFPFARIKFHRGLVTIDSKNRLAGGRSPVFQIIVPLPHSGGLRRRRERRAGAGKTSLQGGRRLGSGPGGPGSSQLGLLG